MFFHFDFRHSIWKYSAKRETCHARRKCSQFDSESIVFNRMRQQSKSFQSNSGAIETLPNIEQEEKDGHASGLDFDDQSADGNAVVVRRI